MQSFEYYVKNFISLFTKNSGILKTISDKTVDTKTPQVSLQSRNFGSFSEGVSGGNTGGFGGAMNKNKMNNLPLPMVAIDEEGDGGGVKLSGKAAMKRVSVYTKTANLADKFTEFMKEELQGSKTKGNKLYF